MTIDLKKRAAAFARRILDSLRPRVEFLPITGATIDRLTEAECAWTVVAHVSEDPQHRFRVNHWGQA
jgi:hypothetical protein